jgi:hypothetical protein
VGRVARLLVAAAVAVPLVGSAAGPAAACACLPIEPQQIVHRADAIISGRIENEISLDATHTRSIVRVEGVYRGAVSAEIFVDTDLGTGGGSSCAVLYPVGSVVDPMVLQKLANGSYTIEQCVIGSMPHVRALLGSARPPPSALSPSGAAPIPVATSTPLPGMSWGAVGLGLLVAVVLIAAAVRWSGRRAVETGSPFDDLPAETGVVPAPTGEGAEARVDPGAGPRGSDASG